MKDLKSIKRIAYIYGIIIAMFVFLMVYAPTKSLSQMDVEVAELEERETDRLYKASIAESIVLGDVYDRNNQLICEYDSETEEYIYQDNMIYSNIIGRVGNENGLLLENLEYVLKSVDGNTDKGDSLVLTLDSELQKKVSGIMNSGDGVRSSAVVLDAKTGAILAMTYNPTYDISQEAPDNKKITTPLLAPWRPGSIYKVVTSVGILEKGWEDKEIKDSGSYTFPSGGRPIYNSGVNEKNAKSQPVKKRNYYTALEYSSNVYFGRMAYDLGWADIEEIASRFLIGQQGIAFEFGEMNSTFESKSEENSYDKSRKNRELATLGYGYGDLQLTTLHAAMITQSIANNGILCMPYMVEDAITTVGVSIGDGEYSYEFGGRADITIQNRQKGKTIEVMNASIAEKIRKAMQRAYTHAKQRYAKENPNDSVLKFLNDEGIVVGDNTYSVAAKTGTADIEIDGQMYNNVWMISMAPVSDPQYIVVVSRYCVQEETFGYSTLKDIASIYEMLFSEQ